MEHHLSIPMAERGNAQPGQAPPSTDFDVLREFSKHRRWNTPISRDLMANADTRDIGQKISNCALSLKAQVILQPELKPQTNLTAARVCNTRFCPFCEWRRTRVRRRRLYDGLTALYEDRPKLRGVFLTLTVRNVLLQDLGDQLDQMNKAWQRFKECSFFPTDLWYRRTEITLGSALKLPDGSRPTRDMGIGPVMAHPHFHVLLLVRPSFFSRDYVKKTEWQKQWQMALRADYAPVIDVRTAKASSTTGSTASGGALDAVLEASKYATKATELLELGPSISELHWQLRRRRMTAISRPLSQYIKDSDISASELMDDNSKPLPEGAESLSLAAQWFEDADAYRIVDVLS